MSTILLSTSKSLFRRLTTRTSAARSLPPLPSRRRPISTTLPQPHNHTSLIPSALPPLPYYSRYGLTPVMRVFRSYGNAQRKRPYVTQLLTSIAIYALGDLNAQLICGGGGGGGGGGGKGEEEEEGGYDVVRTGRMVVIGSVFSIPSYLWFTKLGQSFNFRSKMLAISTRVLVNQVVFTPVFLCAFFTLQNLFCGEGEGTVERLKVTVPQAYAGSCRLWPAVTAINFWVVPVEYRALFGGVVAVGWNGYLSYLNQSVRREVKVHAAAAPVEVVEPVRLAPTVLVEGSSSRPVLAVV